MVVVDRLEHHKYPGLKCIMFSGEDEDELYGDTGT
jgi:hypothetical protein